VHRSEDTPRGGACRGRAVTNARDAEKGAWTRRRQTVACPHRSGAVQAAVDAPGPNQHEDLMATKLEKAIKRELMLDGTPYTITIAPEGLKIVEKGKRKGLELSWKALISGEAALAHELRASLDKGPAGS
jgi:hypothetical protein